MKKAFLILITIFIIIFGSFFRAQNINYRSTFETICYLTFTKVYKEKEEIKPWFYYCMDEAGKNKNWNNHQQFVAYVQSVLDRMGINHLYILSPETENYRKTGKALSTGLISQIDGENLVVKKVIEGSSAEANGIKVGDIVIALKGKDIFHPSETFSTPGLYTFIRSGDTNTKQYSANLTLTEVRENLNIKIKEMGANKASLIVPSFYTEVFSKQYIKSIVDELNKYDSVTIDLRGNLGGHIISGLRLLSGFICRPVVIGQFEKPRVKSETEAFLQDKEDYSEDYHQFFTTKFIKLTTFEDYGCFKGQLAILLNEDTASISEIFALALKEQKAINIYGENSSGQGVMALRYKLDSLGKGYSIIIPESVYVSQAGKMIEGSGVN